MDTRRQRTRRVLLLASFLLLPITLNYFSPYLMTQGTAEGIASASLIVWGAIYASSLVLGRAFCGWICPFHGLQMAWEKAADTPLKRVRWLHATKYLLWFAWMAAVAGVAFASGGWQRVDMLYMTPLVVSIDSAGNLITYFALIGLVLAPVALGKRAFCHYLCPFGVFGIVGTAAGRGMRLPMLRLTPDPEACTACGRCSKECPMSLDVSRMAQTGDTADRECILCATCVDVCPKDAVHLGIAKSARRK